MLKLLSCLCLKIHIVLNYKRNMMVPLNFCHLYLLTCPFLLLRIKFKVEVPSSFPLYSSSKNDQQRKPVAY